MERLYFKRICLVIILLIVGISYSLAGDTKYYYFKVQAVASPSGAGKVYVGNENGTVNSETCNYEETPAESKDGAPQKTIYLKASANYGYQFTEWKLNNTSISKEANCTYTHTLTEKDEATVYTAYFSKIPIPVFYFSAEAIPSPNTGGTASVTLDKTSVSGENHESTSATTTATYRAAPNTGFLFSGWAETPDGSPISAENPYTTLITSTSTDQNNPANKKLYAIFTSKYMPVISMNEAINSIKVDDIVTNAFDFVRTNNIQITVFPDENVAIYDAATNTLTAKNAGKTSITFRQEETNELSAANITYDITVSKHMPNIFWNVPETCSINSNFPNFITINNGESELITFSTTNSAIASILDNTLFIGNTTGTANVTIKHAENYKWEEYSKTYVITTYKANTHVPFTLSENTYSSFKTKNSGAFEWKDGGIRLGDAGDGFDWEDKYIILHFQGIPDKLTFKFDANASGVTGQHWYVEESADNKTFKEKWQSDAKNGNSGEIQLSPNTQYIKLCWSGNFSGNYNNVTVTERKPELNVNLSTIDFDIHIKGGGEEHQTIELTHYNTSNKVSVKSNDEENFSVTPTILENTGGDKYGVETITVSYKNKNIGVHNSSITLSDGTNTKVVNVTGTTQTVYYARGNATATEGGSAYVSASSFDEATSASVNKTSEATSETSANTTLYYKAVPNQYYKFLGWKNSQNDETFVSNETNYAINNFVYYSEDVNNPTTNTLFAIFEPKTVTLDPEDISSLLADDYKAVTFNRTLKQGYNTLALPFDTDVATLTGRNNSNDWVAQLALVTKNDQDGYTLYFTKVEDGTITANQPYILYLGTAVVNPSWTNMTVVAAESESFSAEKNKGWTMKSNYEPEFSMSGKYGIVNSDGNIQKGASSSTLNAFSAYLEGPANSQVKAAFLDDVTAIEEILQQADEDTVIKRIENGKLVILQGDKKYNASGVRLK